MRMEGEDRFQRNGMEGGTPPVRVPGVMGGGVPASFPGDRKCLLLVASCLFPTSHFSVCLPPACWAPPLSLRQYIQLGGGRLLFGGTVTWLAARHSR